MPPAIAQGVARLARRAGLTFTVAAPAGESANETPPTVSPAREYETEEIV